MTDSWPLRSSLELGALSTAVPCACLHVKHVLWEWGLNSLVESAELLVSELVTNAVNATGQPGRTVSVNLAGTGTRVLIGKVVWCELDTASPTMAPLPRRVPRARPKPQVEIVSDLDLLRRLRDGLRS